MAYDVVLAFAKGDYGQCYVLVNNFGSLVWNYVAYVYGEEIYGEDFNYRTQNGKTIDEVYIDKLKPLYNIEFAIRSDSNQAKSIASVLVESEYSFLLNCDNQALIYDKEYIVYDKVYVQDNLKYIDEL